MRHRIMDSYLCAKFHLRILFGFSDTLVKTKTKRRILKTKFLE